MKLVEIRDLDGPNVFLLKPAIKIEFSSEDEEDERAAATRLGEGEDIGAGLIALIDSLHERAGIPGPDVVVVPMETDQHFSVAFSWENRRAARAIAEAAASLTLGDHVDLDACLERAASAVATPNDDDSPELITDSERRIPTIGITATNGKTTTTRLLAHLARTAGLVAGWCTTSGVFIDGEQVLEGDYTGPSGAQRVLRDPKVEIALLETARGGILLRGLGYESNDVSIFINVSADHLGLLGIWTVQGLAMTKSTVSAVTRPNGAVVLNADDPLVWQFADSRPAPVVAVSRNPSGAIARNHVEHGGTALLLEDGEFIWHRNGEITSVIAAEEIPITFSGRAMHMVENAMHATAGALAIGLEIESIRTGLRTFRGDARSNPGRLNLYRTPEGVKVLIDFAHNEAGVGHLLTLAASLVEPGGVLRTVAGSAGDRPDESIKAMVRMAAEASDGGVYLRGTQKYLRGRASNEALSQLYYDALAEAGREAAGHWETEFDAAQHAVEDSRAGDVVAIMAYEQGAAIRDWLGSSGAVAEH
jgi:cyanophycin synthetase